MSRSKEEIEASLSAHRAKMSEDVEELVDQVHPDRVRERAVDDAKGFVRSTINDFTKEFKDEQGWRWDRIALVAGAVVGGLVTISVARNVLGNRKSLGHRKSRKHKSLEKRLHSLTEHKHH